MRRSASSKSEQPVQPNKGFPGETRKPHPSKKDSKTAPPVFEAHTPSTPGLDDHPIASVFPLMNGVNLAKLAEDIKTNGQLEKIVIYEGKILDGRNRYRACRLAGKDPKLVDFRKLDEAKNFDPFKFVVAKNVERRQLTNNQRAAVAARMSTLEPGDVASQRHDVSNETPRISLAMAAKTMSVSRAQVARAKKLLREDPERFAEMEAGTKTLGQATDKLPKRSSKPKPSTEATGKSWQSITDDLAKLSPNDPAFEKQVREGLEAFQLLALRLPKNEPSTGPELAVSMPCEDIVDKIWRVFQSINRGRDGDENRPRAPHKIRRAIKRLVEREGLSQTAAATKLLKMIEVDALNRKARREEKPQKSEQLWAESYFKKLVP